MARYIDNLGFVVYEPRTGEGTSLLEFDLNSFREPPTAQAYFRHNAMIVQSRGQPSDIGDGIVGDPPCNVLGALGFAAGARGSLPLCREVTRLSDRSVLFGSRTSSAC